MKLSGIDEGVDAKGIMKLAESRIFRILASILFGLLGFGVNFLDIQLLDSPEFKISILAGLFFPLLIALAWGWRYGLLAALAGGCQSMWWLWRSDGWGFLYAVPVFTLWIVWHGWWAERRSKQARYPWYESIFIVEMPFRIVIELGFYTIFRWLVSFNPPPWDMAITWDYVPLSWVHLVAIKHTVTAYIIILTSYTILSFQAVRRFFGLKRRPAQRESAAIFSAAILMGLLLWIMDSIVMFLVYNPHAKTFWETTIFQVEPHEMFMRLLYMILSLTAAVFMTRVVRQRVQYQEGLEHLNKVLLAIRNVNQLITNVNNQDELITKACQELVATRGYDSVWIALLSEDGKLIQSAEMGIGERFIFLMENMEKGVLTNCGRQALSTPDVVIKNNPVKECADCPQASYYGTRGAMSVRLEHAGRIYGLLTVSCQTEYVADEAEQRLLHEIAGDIAIALQNIDLRREKEKSEIVLRESEERFRVLVESAPMSILLARGGRYIFANPSCAQLMGYNSPAELVGLDIYKTLAPEYHRLIEERVNRIEQKQDNPLMELQVLRPNGERVWVISTSLSIKMDGEQTAMIVGQDISALKKSQEQLEQALKEKEILLQELYHRTKNNMQVVQTMLALRESYIQDVQLQSVLKDVQEKIFAMALVHQKLYESQDLSSIDLKEYFEELVQYLEQSFDVHRKRIEIEFDLESVPVLIDTAIPCGLVLSELITNAYKYAFPDDREGKIIVRLQRNETNAILIEVSDNGVGLSKDYEIREGDTMGLETVFGIVQHQLAGEIKINSQAGLSWQICFKERAIQPRV